MLKVREDYTPEQWQHFAEYISAMVLDFFGDTLQYIPENGEVEIRILLNKNKEHFSLKESKGLKRNPDLHFSNIPEMGLPGENHLEIRKYLSDYPSSINHHPRQDEAGKEREDAFVCKVRKVLERNLDNETFNIHNLCRELAMSRAQLYRRFNATHHMAIGEYLKNLRLNKALHLLASSDLNVTQVAFAVGFKNLSHFSRVFTHKFGKTPKKMQKN
jgi:AraC-like DNA-binding protein